MRDDPATDIQRPVKAKVEAVTRVMAGEEVQVVAASMGIEAPLVRKWERAFRSAGKNALRYTAEPDERPTLRGLRHAAQKAFPSWLVGPSRSAACFFVGQFYGKNDVVHLYSMGMRDVTLVDADADRLEHMASIYPDEWVTHVDDAFERARTWRDEGRTFDLVVCDPYTNMADKVAWDDFELFAALAEQYLCLLYTKDMFDRLGIEPEAAALGTALGGRLERSVTCLDVVRRSTHAGGVFWATFAGHRHLATPG